MHCLRVRGIRVSRYVPDHRVDEVTRSESGFQVRHRYGLLHAARLILATGGQSLPKTGSDGFGYRLARLLGHHVTPTVPALVPLLLDRSMFHTTLSGLSQEVALTTQVGGREADRRTGSLLWTHFGISGPVVMDASRFWTLATNQGVRVDLYGNFVPGRSSEVLKEWFLRQTAEHPKRSVVRTLSLLVPERFAESLCRHSSCDPPAHHGSDRTHGSRSVVERSNQVSISDRGRPRVELC